METQAEGSSGGLRTAPWDGIFARLARRMFSSCERTTRILALRIHVRGMVATKKFRADLSDAFAQAAKCKKSANFR
jgi:hypothetical protein